MNQPVFRFSCSLHICWGKHPVCRPQLKWVAGVQRTAGSGPRADPVCTIQRWSDSSDRAVRSVATPISRRHTDRRLVWSEYDHHPRSLTTWPAGCHRIGPSSTRRQRNWCGAPHPGVAMHQVPTDSLVISLDAIKPVVTARDLGLRLDAVMSTRDHIRRLTSTCVGCVDVPWQIQYCIRRSLSSHARTMLVTCFILSRLDYCNAMFSGRLPRCHLDRLQAIQNVTVRLIPGNRKFDHHVTSLLRER